MSTAATGKDDIGRASIQANGLTQHYLELGQGPLLICLHGFPDSAWGFTAVMPLLARQGFRVVTPFMRGYAPTGPAPDGDYSVVALADDALALADALGDGRCRIIGHDWGGVAGICAAAMRPKAVERLVVSSVWHPARMRWSWRQLRLSAYMFLFQLPLLAEQVVAADDFAFVDYLYRNWSPHWRFDSNDLAAAKDCLRKQGGLEAALAYYRRNILRSTPLQRRLLAGVTTVPALLVYGSEDGCIDPDVIRASATAFSDLRGQVAIEAAGHFPHREFPQYFADAVGAFLA